LRKGTIGIALATAGFEPIEDVRGKPDLFGRELEITLRAIADDLASAAQFVIGETNSQTPIAVVRGAEVDFTENPKLETEMPPEEDLYMNIFSKFLLRTHKEKFDNGELL
jgi:F420-0:gamma-glutamyl ligase